MPRHLDLNQNPHFSHLQRLAENPPDLPTLLARPGRRFSDLCMDAGRLRLSYACERVDANILDALQAFADHHQLTEQFQQMSQGEKMNAVEGFTSNPLGALHTLCRGFPAAAEAPDIPLRRELEREMARIQDALKALDQGTWRGSTDQPFKTLIQIGIGGSELGPKALFAALAHQKKPRRALDFVSNVDPDHLNAALNTMDLPTTLFAVVSKSGSTLETAANEQAIRHALQQAGLDARLHMVAVTTPGSKLDRDALFRQRFYMFDEIGGRFSATSAVGAFCLGFALGMPAFEALLQGARDMDQACLEPRIRQNPSLLMALLSLWNRNLLHIPSHAILPYNQALREFIAHLQQCQMESNGKRINRYGQPLAYHTSPVLWGAPGTNGQHSFYQQLHQGTQPVSCTFILFEQAASSTAWAQPHQQHLNANGIAQSIALAMGQPSDNPNHVFPGNRPSHTLTAQHLGPQTLGNLLALFENKIAFEGFIWNVNSFDQEGVQLGKRLAHALSQAPDNTSNDPMVKAARALQEALFLDFEK